MSDDYALLCTRAAIECNYYTAVGVACKWNIDVGGANLQLEAGTTTELGRRHDVSIPSKIDT